MTISSEIRERRRRAVRQAIASARLEGREVGAETQSDMNLYAEGEITEDEILERFHQLARSRVSKAES